MTLKITSNSLKELTESFSYRTIGDINEITYGHFVVDKFNNSELFWKNFITPITKRVDSLVLNPNEKIRPRQNISLDLHELSSFHYSVFLNLVYAELCLTKKHFSFFENFYAHLGSVCDLAEEFLTQLYFITLECEEKETTILQKLSKIKFIDIAKEWYDQHYKSAYEHYLSKGKTAPMKLISRSNILDEYFNKSKQWKDYCKTALEIRTYRNVVVHNTQIASVTDSHSWLVYVPKRSKISNYKKWHQVFKVTQERFPHDFIEREAQMRQDIDELKGKLQAIWEKPLQHFDKLLYLDKNKKLVAKFDIMFDENNGVQQ